MVSIWLGRGALLLVVIVTLTANILVLLPAGLTFYLFTALTFVPSRLVLVEDSPVSVPPHLHNALVVVDEGGLVPDIIGLPHWPIPLVQEWLERRRREHLKRVGYIDWHVQAAGYDEQYVSRWSVHQVWWEDKDIPMVLVLPGARALERGEYQVRAVLRAGPRWCASESDDPIASYINYTRAVWPGQFRLKPMSASMTVNSSRMMREIRDELRKTFIPDHEGGSE